MRRGWRSVALIPGVAVLLAVLVWGYTGLPGFGAGIPQYGRVIDAIAQQQRHLTNFVTAVMFDYRGVDTMVEEFILFASVLGVALLLRSTRDIAEDPPRDAVTAVAVRTGGGALAPVLMVFGLWVISFGYITPGGGFQGGVIAAGGALLLFLAGSYRTFRHAAPETLVDAAEGLGAAGYVGIGLLGLAAGSPFLFNAIPLGSAGTLASSGTIAALNWASGIEVAAAFVLLFGEFLEEHIEALAEAAAEPGEAA